MNNKKEIRYLKDAPELRTEDGKAPVISGYAAVYSPARSSDLGGFIETVDSHAFDDSISGDIKGLFNHDPSNVLGRTKSGTMRVSSDSHGLHYEIDCPETQLGRDLVTSMRRGDIDSSSFAFTCHKDSWEQTDDGQMLRTILKATVWDCSVVTTPAYPDASSMVRSLFPDGKVEIPVLRSKKDDDEDEDYDEDCQCRCSRCVGGECDACENPNCDEESCRCWQRKMRMRMQAALLTHGVVVRAESDTKKIDGEELSKSDFAYQGEKKEDWKLPYKFSTAAKSESHVRNAISRWSHTDMPDAAEKSKARGRLKSAAKKYGIELGEDSLK